MGRLFNPGGLAGHPDTCGAYSLSHLESGTVEYQRVFLGTGVVAGAIGVACYLAKYDLSRGFFVTLFAIGLPALLLTRFSRRRLLKRFHVNGMLLKPVLVAGSPAHIDEVTRVLRREKWLGYKVVGAVTPAAIEETACRLPVLGQVSDVVDLVQDQDIHAVIFAEDPSRTASTSSGWPGNWKSMTPR